MYITVLENEHCLKFLGPEFLYHWLAPWHGDGLYPEVSERVGVTPSKKAEQPLPGLATDLDHKREMAHVYICFI